ncbi:hypothetical protein Bcep18194_C7309 [Burkholderia lata]|uniref:Uncharacterized protein n=1 Tax=Burkholderia lata (strain ATCC 17760 / DSM 23089 / LMG 22485 / NCIMB 9086 / R18194 / 383) TaxID=482957 RepID=Q39MG3_BURL3|nr:hypothetical protein Bcep18194_C7309 [Burkholderia lata]
MSRRRTAARTHIPQGDNSHKHRIRTRNSQCALRIGRFDAGIASSGLIDVFRSSPTQHAASSFINTAHTVRSCPNSSVRSAHEISGNTFPARIHVADPITKKSVRTRRSARRNMTTRHLRRLQANVIDQIPATIIDAGENYYAYRMIFRIFPSRLRIEVRNVPIHAVGQARIRCGLDPMEIQSSDIHSTER